MEHRNFTFVKNNLKIGAGILITVLVIILYFLQLPQNNPALESEVNHEQVASKFIYENDPAFIEDGYELKLISKEKVDDKNIKMTFFYKLYSYPEGDQFRSDIIVNIESGVTHFIDK